jgi:hypothetical protein
MLKDQVCVVTGAAQGIGLSLARLLVEAGIAECQTLLSGKIGNCTKDSPNSESPMIMWSTREIIRGNIGKSILWIISFFMKVL